MLSACARRVYLRRTAGSILWSAAIGNRMATAEVTVDHRAEFKRG